MTTIKEKANYIIPISTQEALSDFCRGTWFRSKNDLSDYLFSFCDIDTNVMKLVFMSGGNNGTVLSSVYKGKWLIPLNKSSVLELTL